MCGDSEAITHEGQKLGYKAESTAQKHGDVGRVKLCRALSDYVINFELALQCNGETLKLSKQEHVTIRECIRSHRIVNADKQAVWKPDRSLSDI